MRGAMSASEALAIREGLGLSRAQWADILGVHSTTVLRWENGDVGVPPSMANLVRLAAAAEAKTEIVA